MKPTKLRKVATAHSCSTGSRGYAGTKLAIYPSFEPLSLTCKPGAKALLFPLLPSLSCSALLVVLPPGLSGDRD